MVLEMTDQEAVDDPPDGHLTQPRVKPAAGGVSRRQGPDPCREATRLGGNPAEQLGGRQLPIAPDPLDPFGIGRDAPEWHWLGSAGEDVVDLDRPVPEHLGCVGEDLLRAPVGFGLGAVGLAERPRVTGLDGRPEGLERDAR